MVILVFVIPPLHRLLFPRVRPLGLTPNSLNTLAPMARQVFSGLSKGELITLRRSGTLNLPTVGSCPASSSNWYVYLFREYYDPLVEVFLQTFPSILCAILGQKNIRRAPGQFGRLNK